MPHGTSISSYDIFLFSFRIRPPSRSIELIDGIDICDIRCSRLTAMAREQFEKFGRYRTSRRGRRLLSNAIKFRGQGFSRGEERDGNIFTRARVCAACCCLARLCARGNSLRECNARRDDVIGVTIVSHSMSEYLARCGCRAATTMRQRSRVH